MAESILFDIAGEIIRKLGSRAVREVALWWGVQAEIDKLRDTVDTIQAVLLDAEEKREHNNQVKLWFGKLKHAMYDAEDLLDDFSTEALQRQAMDGSRLTKEVRLFFSRSNQFAYGLKMGHKIKSLRERLAGINADRSSFHLEVGNPGGSRAVMGKVDRQTDSVIPEVVIGREEDKKAVIKLLLDSWGGEGISVVPIVGIGGLGKTTLAQLIFHDEQIKACFELTMWVCVSDNFEVHTIVKNILESAAKEKQESLQTSVLIDHLQKTISGKKFLLVLDDVWNENGEKWDRLKKLLKGGANGSKILLTTRSKKVAEITSWISPYMLEGLSKDDSWLLFKQYAFRQDEECKGPRLEEIGREIVRKCVGVPLAIRTIGRMLYFMNTEAEWLAFNDNVAQNDDDENDLMPTLKLSYDHLPSHLKRCFAFCCLFPKDHLLNAETLIDLWVAEGFVTQSSHSGGCFEDLGHGYFMDLLWRGFFQEVRRDVLGNVVSCKMHDLMHDLACIVGGSESKIIDKNSGIVIDENALHASVGYELEGERQIPFQLIGASRLRTFILPCQLRIGGSFFFGGYRWENSGLDIFSKFKSLRSLELCGLEIEKLPAFIKKLKHLRYLNLSGNGKIKVLPNWITRLLNLQVLKLCGCKSLIQLPKDIRKLKNLGCLDCRGCYALSQMPHGLRQLTSLWRLTVFVVGEGSVSSGASKHKYESSGLEELYGLNNLRGSLEIKNLGNVRNGEREFEAANLKGKNLLQSLDLDWGRRDWTVVDTDYEERCFQGLQPHQNLKGLFVDGYGGVRFPSWFSSLTNLVKITIYNCRKCQFLPPFHQFPSLQELRIWSLWDLEYMVEDNDGEINNAESSSSSSTLFFPSLKSLKLHSCPKLKGWWKNHGNSSAATSTGVATVPLKMPHFHRLSTLEIWRCPNLTQMPLFPSVSDELQLEGSSLEPLRQTMEMKRSSTMATSSTSSSFSSSGTLVMHPPLSELKMLKLEDIGDLEALPEEWLQNLTSLRELRIWNCPNLKLLPQGMKHHLTSLQRLKIVRCPQLEERCGNKRGADWPIISHIPDIYIGSQDIQIDGRCLLDG